MIFFRKKTTKNHGALPPPEISVKTLSVGALNPTRLQTFIERYQDTEEDQLFLIIIYTLKRSIPFFAFFSSWNAFFCIQTCLQRVLSHWNTQIWDFFIDESPFYARRSKQIWDRIGANQISKYSTRVIDNECPPFHYKTGIIAWLIFIVRGWLELPDRNLSPNSIKFTMFCTGRIIPRRELLFITSFEPNPSPHSTSVYFLCKFVRRQINLMGGKFDLPDRLQSIPDKMEFHFWCLCMKIVDIFPFLMLCNLFAKTVSWATIFHFCFHFRKIYAKNSMFSHFYRISFLSGMDCIPLHTGRLGPFLQQYLGCQGDNTWILQTVRKFYFLRL